MNQQLTPAEIRLAQYGQRTSTWSTATYNDGTEKALHEIALGLKAEVDRLRDALAKEEHLHGDTIDGPDPLAYGPTGIPCGCGKDAHSNLVPCQPDPVASIGSITIRSESIQLDNGECLRDLAIGDSVELRADTGHEGLWIAAAFHGDFQDRITLQYAEVVEDCGQDPAVACEFSGTRHAHPFDLDGKIRPRPVQPLALDQVEARANAATPGPWRKDATQDDTPVIHVPRTTPNGMAYAHVLFQADWATEADAEFAAHARSDVKAMAAEIRRLRAELADFSGRVNELESKLCDCEPVREHDDYKRPAFYQHEAHCPVTELTQPAAEETHVVADDSSDPEHIDDCPGCTRPCGHDDYHEPHEWADRPGVWCPGISYADDEPAAARP